MEMNVEGALHQFRGRFEDRRKAKRESVERGGENKHPCAEHGHDRQVSTPTPDKLQLIKTKPEVRDS